MADEAASLFVRITGDASSLEAAVSGVASSLEQLESKGTGISQSTQKAIEGVSKGTKTYSDILSVSKTNLDKKNAAMKQSDDAYAATEKLVKKNVSALESERNGIKELIDAQQKRIDRYEELKRASAKNSTAYKLNDEALKKEYDSMKELEKEYGFVSSRIDYQNEILNQANTERMNAAEAARKARDEYSVLSSNMDEIIGQERAFKQQEFGEHLQNMGSAVDEATKPLQTLALATAAGGVAAAKFAIDFEDDFSAVKKTVEGTPEQLEEVKQGIIDLTTVGLDGRSPLPMTTKELTELAAAGGQLGISTENIVDFTEVMAQLGTATNLVGEEGASELARFRNVMQIPESEIRNVGSAVVDLGNNMATTEAEIMTMSNRMGKYGQTVGMGAADVLGYSAALSSLGVEAELGGSAIGRTWLSIETAVASGGESLQAFAKYSNKSAQEFSDAWNADASGAFMGLLEGLSNAENLTLALSELGINNTQDIQAIMSMASNYDLVAEAVERANTAYQENTALQDEFNAKAETTASKIQITKNNMVEAARSIGETMLPTIADASEGISGFAKKLAGLDEDTQKTIVKTGIAIVGAGVAAKGVSGTLESVGSAIEGFSKLKTVGKVITSGLTNPIVGATAAAAAFAIAGYKVYETWYNSKYNWSDGLNEGAESIRNASEELVKLSNLKTEVQDLQLVIKSPESSKEEVNAAKQRIKEIGELLAEEYNLHINVDNMDDVEKAITVLSSQQRKETVEKTTGYLDDLRNKSENYVSSKAEVAEDEKEAYRLESLQSEYDGLRIKAELLRDSYRSGKIQQDEYTESMDKLRVQARETAEAFGEPSGAFDEWGTITSADEVELFLDNFKLVSERVDGQLRNLTGDNGSITVARKNMEDYVNSAKEAASGMAAALASDLNKGFFDNAEQDIAQFESLGLILKGVEADTFDVAQQFAVAKQGFTDFSQAIDSGAVSAVADDFINFQISIGQSAETAVQGAALLKNGFTDVSQAIEAGAVSAVVKDLKALGEAQGLDMTIDKLNELAHSMGLIGSAEAITVTAEGNFEVFNEAQQAINDINSNSDIRLSVDADGNITLLESADETLNELMAKQNVSFSLNVDTGNIDVLDSVGTKIAEIDGKTGNVTVVFDADTTAPDSYQPDPKEGGVTYTATMNPWEPPVKYGTVVYSVKSYIGDIVSKSSSGSKSVTFNAKGTDYFQGGLAMVNDQKGIPDPRELVIDKGMAFIPEGRDVILPLSRGAKVYTASQTKAIMKGIGIPHYADGKDNSDGFTTARDDWTHYINTHAVTTSQELEKWVELSNQFKDNAKDIADIEEQIYSLTKKQNEELNESSIEYLELRTAMNDWEDVNDDPISAYSRINERNAAELEAGRLTWDEYADVMKDAGNTLYEGRIEQSRKWLEHEREYNDMSTSDYIEGLRRMQAYTQEFFEQGIIGAQEYRDSWTEINENIFDAYKEQNQEILDSYFKSADNYKKIRDTFNDWDDVGDSEIRYYTARLANVEKLHRDGIISSWQDYMDMSMDEYLNLYQATEADFDKKLEEYRDFISETESKYRDEEQALRDSWTVEDRETDLNEVNRLLGIYENAATEQGREKYQELLDQKKQLEREEELYQLQQDNNASLEALEAEYAEMEATKEKTLKAMRTDQFNIFKEAENIAVDTSNIEELASLAANTMLVSAGSVENVLYQILNQIRNMTFSQSTYNDGRTFSISSGMSENEARRLLNGTIVSGLGSVIWG